MQRAIVVFSGFPSSRKAFMLCRLVKFWQWRGYQLKIFGNGFFAKDLVRGLATNVTTQSLPHVEAQDVIDRASHWLSTCSGPSIAFCNEYYVNSAKELLTEVPTILVRITGRPVGTDLDEDLSFEMGLSQGHIEPVREPELLRKLLAITWMDEEPASPREAVLQLVDMRVSWHNQDKEIKRLGRPHGIVGEVASYLSSTCGVGVKVTLCPVDGLPIPQAILDALEKNTEGDLCASFRRRMRQVELLLDTFSVAHDDPLQEIAETPALCFFPSSMSMFRSDP